MNKIIFFMLLFSTSIKAFFVEDIDPIKLFESFYRPLLISTYEVEKMNEPFWGERGILGPQWTWQPLFLMKTIHGEENFCLLYRYPNEGVKGQEEGTLKIISLHENDECKKNILKKGEFEIDKIKKIRFLFDERTRELSLKFERQEKEKDKNYSYEINFLFANLGYHEQQKKSKFHNFKSNQLVSGTWVLGVSSSPAKMMVRTDLSKRKEIPPPCGGKDMVPCLKGEKFEGFSGYFCEKGRKIFMKNNKEEVCL